MFTVRLKSGTTVEVPLEQLEEFLENNKDRIEPQHKVIGKRRAIPYNKIALNL